LAAVVIAGLLAILGGVPSSLAASLRADASPTVTSPPSGGPLNNSQSIEPSPVLCGFDPTYNAPFTFAAGLVGTAEPAASMSLPPGSSTYFYVGSGAGGRPLTDISWNEDLPVTAAYSGNKSISIGRSTSDSGSLNSNSSTNVALAGLAVTGYQVTGHPVTNATSTGTSVSVTATTNAGDLLLVVVGGEGDGLLQQGGTPLSTLINVTYSECGSDVIASAGMFAAFPGAGLQTVTFSGITYPTNSGTSMGVAAYVLAPTTTTTPPVPPAAACSTSPASAAPGQAPPHLITALATPTAPPASAAAGTPYQGSYCVVAEVMDASGDPVTGTAVTFDVTTPTGGFSITKSTDDAGGAAIVVPSSGSLTAATMVNIVSGSVSTSIGVTENWLPGDHTNAVVGLGVAGQSITWPASSAAQDGLCYANAYLTTTTTSSCQRVYRNDGWGSGQPVTMPAAAATLCQAFDAVTTVITCAATALTPAVCLLGAESGPLACGAYIAGITGLGLPVQCAEALAGALGDAITADHGPSSAISAADFSTISPQDIRTPEGASSGIQDVVGVACAVVPVLKLAPAQIPQPASGATTAQVTLSVNGVAIPNAVASLTFTPGFQGGGSRAEVIVGGASYPLSAAPVTVAFDSADDPIQITYTYPTSALYKEVTLTDIITAIPGDTLAGTLAPTAAYTSQGARQPPCGPTICSSATHADIGQSVTVTARGFTPGSSVTFLIESAPRLLGRASASASGTAQLTFAVPQAAGTGMHVVSAVGYSGHGKILARSIALAIHLAPGSTRTWVILVAGLAVLALLAAIAWRSAAMKRQRRSRAQRLS
jgi:hypothetical protein